MINQRQVSKEADQWKIMQAIDLVEKQYLDSSLQNEDKCKDKVAKITQGRWTQNEHQRFLEALSLYGKNWKKVEDHIQSRSGAQIRSHAQKFFNRLERETKLSFNGLKSAQIKSIFEERIKQQQQVKKDNQKKKIDEKAQEIVQKQNEEKINLNLEQKPLLTEQQINQLLANGLLSFRLLYFQDLTQISQIYSLMNKNHTLSNIRSSLGQQEFIQKSSGKSSFQLPYLTQILQGQENGQRKLSDLIDTNCDISNKNVTREITQGRSRKGSFLLYQDQDSNQLDKYESLKKAKQLNLSYAQQEIQNQGDFLRKNSL